MQKVSQLLTDLSAIYSGLNAVIIEFNSSALREKQNTQTSSEAVSYTVRQLFTAILKFCDSV